MLRYICEAGVLLFNVCVNILTWVYIYDCKGILQYALFSSLYFFIQNFGEAALQD